MCIKIENLFQRWQLGVMSPLCIQGLGSTDRRARECCQYFIEVSPSVGLKRPWFDYTLHSPISKCG